MNEQHALDQLAAVIDLELLSCPVFGDVRYTNVTITRLAIAEAFGRIISKEHILTQAECYYIKEALGLPAKHTESEIQEFIDKVRQKDGSYVLTLMEKLSENDIEIIRLENAFNIDKYFHFVRFNGSLAYNALRTIEEIMNVFCGCIMENGDTEQTMYRRIALSKQAAGILEEKNAALGLPENMRYKTFIPPILNRLELDIRYNVYAVLAEDDPFRQKNNAECTRDAFVEASKAVAKKGTDCQGKDKKIFVNAIQAGMDIPIEKMNAVLYEPKQSNNGRKHTIGKYVVVGDKAVTSGNWFNQDETTEDMIARLTQEDKKKILDFIFPKIFWEYRKYYKLRRNAE